MPEDHALLRVEVGDTTAVVDGKTLRLTAGDEVYLGADDRVDVASRSLALLTYRGGATSWLCAGTVAVVGPMRHSGRPLTPIGALEVQSGLVVTDTTSPSAAYRPFVARQHSPAGDVVSSGRAWFELSAWGVTVAKGVVTLNGLPIAATGGQLGCGGGSSESPPIPGLPPTTEATATDTPSAIPSPSVTPSPSPTPSPTTAPTTSSTTTNRPPPTTTTRKTTRPPTTPAQPPLTTFEQAWLLSDPIAQRPPAGTTCAGQNPDVSQIAEGVYATFLDGQGNHTEDVIATFTWVLDTDKTSGSGAMSWGDGIDAGGFIVDYAQSHTEGGTLTITIRAREFSGRDIGSRTLTAKLDVCRPASTNG